MQKLILITFFTILTTGLAPADELLDDFEQGKTQNNWGGSWFYFSDVKDSGNSEILNATLLNNGSYSSLIPDTGGYNSSNCAKMEFILGEKAPQIDNYIPTTNFVGIGTDLKPKSGIADIHTAKGIKFKARASQDMVIFMELVTSTIYDYDYYRTYFIVTPSWSEFSVDFNDTNVFFPHRFCSSNYGNDEEFRKNHPLNLNKVIKVNWQVLGDNDANYCLGTHPQSLSESWDSNPKSNCLYLDDIFIIGISPTSITIPDYSISHSKNVPQFITSSGDLLGRRVDLINFSKKSAGIYFLNTEKTLSRLFINEKR